MEDTSGTSFSVQRVDVNTMEDWKTPPKVEFEKAASLEIARLVLRIFGAVYIGAFLLVFVALFLKDATVANITDVLKFLIQSLLPLVTLAVGYYLGDRSSQLTAEA